MEVNSKIESPSALRTTGAIAAGIGTMAVLRSMGQYGIEQAAFTAINDICDKINPQDLDEFFTQGEKAIRETGLTAKGVSTRTMNMPFLGPNAAYNRNNKEIILNGKNSFLSFFHEIGHAQNHLNGWFGKLLQKIHYSKMPSIIVAPVVLWAFLKNKKAQGEKSSGFFDKTTDFVKENIGKLTFLGFLPKLAEEALASFKGQKLAKPLIEPKLFKAMVSGNKIGFLSYLATAGLASACTALMMKIKDSIAHNKIAN